MSLINEPVARLLHTSSVNISIICGRVSAEEFIMSYMDITSGICIAAYYVKFIYSHSGAFMELSYFPSQGRLKRFHFLSMELSLRDSLLMAGFWGLMALPRRIVLLWLLVFNPTHGNLHSFISSRHNVGVVATYKGCEQARDRTTSALMSFPPAHPVE